MTPVSTPLEGIYLELGILSLNTIIKTRRINFLYYLVTRNESEIISKVFRKQWNNPVKSDWTEKVKADLIDFKIEINLSEIKSKSKHSFKKYVKVKAAEFECSQLQQTGNAALFKLGEHGCTTGKNHLQLQNKDGQLW